jgi:hypothetical protein
MGFDLVAHSVLWQVSHLQHGENGAGISVAPLDEGW